MDLDSDSKKRKTGAIRVGVLRGGPSGEYEVSLGTGASVLENLPKDKYYPIDVFIDRKGKWHLSGAVTDPQKILKHLDVVLNGLHGEYGEDGKVQKLLENLFIPFTGSPSLPSALAMNKVLSKNIFDKIGLQMPKSKVIRKEEANYLKIFEAFSHLNKPLVVKPATAGSSLGVEIVESLEDLTSALNEAFKYSSTALVEECVKGREITCAVIEGFKGDDNIYPLPPIEIRPPTDREFFDYNAKYSGKTEEICPAEISSEDTKKVQDIAIKTHKALGLRHYSRADMIIGENGETYLLETNTLPGLTPESLFPKALKASGCGLEEFLDHLITLALYKK